MLTTADFLSPVLDNMPSEWETIEAELIAQLAPVHATYTPWQHAQLEAIAKSRWYLLRNDGPVAAPAKCRNCGRVHEYYTSACMERPFHGLQDLTAAVERVVGASIAIDTIPLGTIEPISAGEAAQLMKRILARPQFCKVREESRWQVPF